MQITKKQHYVWRHYLRAWAHHEKIWCAMDGKKIKTNLMGVAQERYFYRVGEMTERDVHILKGTLIDSISNPVRRQNAAAWIPLVQGLFSSRAPLLKLGIPQDVLDRILEDQSKQIGEDYQGMIESSGIEYLNSLLQSDDSFITSQDSYMQFVFFLMSQYFRTLRIRQNLKRSLEDRLPGYVDRSMATIIPVMATITASAIISGERGLKPYLISNETDLDFITGDQPIINTFAADLGPEEIVENEEEFYYPISPKKAFLLSKNKSLGTGKFVEAEVVRELNRKMVVSAERQIFACEESQLDPWVSLVGQHRS